MKQTKPAVTLAAIRALAAALDEDLGAESWMASGLCGQIDPEMFFPGPHDSTATAKQVCVACPVRTQCLQYALDHKLDDGIWGGVAGRTRQTARRRAEKAQAA